MLIYLIIVKTKFTPPVFPNTIFLHTCINPPPPPPTDHWFEKSLHIHVLHCCTQKHLLHCHTQYTCKKRMGIKFAQWSELLCKSLPDINPPPPPNRTLIVKSLFFIHVGPALHIFHCCTQKHLLHCRTWKSH